MSKVPVMVGELVWDYVRALVPETRQPCKAALEDNYDGPYRLRAGSHRFIYRFVPAPSRLQTEPVPRLVEQHALVALLHRDVLLPGLRRGAGVQGDRDAVPAGGQRHAQFAH